MIFFLTFIASKLIIKKVEWYLLRKSFLSALYWSQEHFRNYAKSKLLIISKHLGFTGYIAMIGEEVESICKNFEEKSDMIK